MTQDKSAPGDRAVASLQGVVLAADGEFTVATKTARQPPIFCISASEISKFA
jgi:hypothetical protein